MKRQQQAAREVGDCLGPEDLPALQLPPSSGTGEPLCEGMGDSSFVPKALQLVITLYNLLQENIQKCHNY